MSRERKKGRVGGEGSKGGTRVEEEEGREGPADSRSD